MPIDANSAPAPGRAILAGGAAVAYLACGSGTPLVLLHGIGSAAQSWRFQLEGLSDRRCVIAWDAPGYGDSTPLEGSAPSPADYAARLLAFVETLDAGRLHLVGHSLGALVASQFAADYPDRVLSLTLASASTGHATLSDPERDRLRDARLDDLATLGPRGMAEKRGPRLVSHAAPHDVRQAVIETMARVRPAGYAQAVRMLSQGDTAANLRRLPGWLPMQVVFGSADVVTPPEQNRTVAAARAGTPVHVIEGAGHAVYLEQPSAFNERLAEFIDAN